MPLTDIALRNAKPKDKPYKLTDWGGLYVLVNKKGYKYWRYDYRYQGKRKTLALGVYPAIGLKQARIKHEEARELLGKGIDPAIQRKVEKVTQIKNNQNNFEAVAREWHEKHKHTWTEGHAKTILHRLNVNIFPYIGFRAISEIEPPDILAPLRIIEERGAVHTAHRIRALCGQIFRYAVATGRAQRDPTADLKGAIPPAKSTHFASITDPKKIGELLRAIDDYQGDFTTAKALQLSPYVFVRPGELRKAEWIEVDFDAKQWIIPAEKMKMKRAHIVPLANQAIKILEDIQQLTSHRQYIFPSLRSPRRPMSNNTINAALRRLGYDKTQMTAHGFRSLASTRLNELGYKPDLIEKQLAHEESNKIRAAYNRAEYLEERTEMMTAWANYLDSLRIGAEVIPIRANQ